MRLTGRLEPRARLEGAAEEHKGQEHDGLFQEGGVDGDARHQRRDRARRERGDGAERDQRVHVGRAAREGAGAVDEQLAARPQERGGAEGGAHARVAEDGHEAGVRALVEAEAVEEVAQVVAVADKGEDPRKAERAHALLQLALLALGQRRRQTLHAVGLGDAQRRGEALARERVGRAPRGRLGLARVEARHLDDGRLGEQVDRGAGDARLLEENVLDRRAAPAALHVLHAQYEGRHAPVGERDLGRLALDARRRGVEAPRGGQARRAEGGEPRARGAGEAQQSRRRSSELGGRLIRSRARRPQRRGERGAAAGARRRRRAEAPGRAQEQHPHAPSSAAPIRSKGWEARVTARAACEISDKIKATASGGAARGCASSVRALTEPRGAPASRDHAARTNTSRVPTWKPCGGD